MMGLEPTAFCMASERSVRIGFAPVRSNGLLAGLPSKRANASAPERTPNLAILATELRPVRLRATSGWGGWRRRPLLAFPPPD
jgi:hypothetical protein